MTKFFDDYFNLKKMVREKRAYRHQMARVDALPADYRFVFQKIQGHMWMFASGAGYDMMRVHEDLIDLFASGAANGTPVLALTGHDVAAFCDELLRDAQTYTDQRRHRLNQEIHKGLDSGTHP